jgi:hypothetical protein
VSKSIAGFAIDQACLVSHAVIKVPQCDEVFGVEFHIVGA